MPLFLRKRDTDLKEYMDDPNCDLDLLYSTYDQFKTVNRLIGGWRRIYVSKIRPALLAAESEPSILDIGCGGGDILRMLSTLCEEDDLNVQFTGLEPDNRAIEYIKKKTWGPNFSFLNTHSGDLARQGRTFTVVLSNHLLHHLTKAELHAICADAESLADDLVIFSDIERSDIGYLLFTMLAPLFFRNSFIAADGTLSIRRSYRKKELQAHLPGRWKVRRQFPFRLLTMFERD
jgi:2-polyprenyl-3-methyl-5-hydroxy-6-metoxy-1,4-benzoquinol methylase